MSNEALRDALRGDEGAELARTGRLAPSLLDLPVTASHTTPEARCFLLGGGTIVVLPLVDAPFAWTDTDPARWQQLVAGELRIAAQPDPATPCMLFANSDLATEGGWDDMVMTGTLDEALAHPLPPGADWAHIIDNATGNTLYWKSRAVFRGDIEDAKWFRPGEGPTIWPSPDDTTVDRHPLTHAESAKLRSLGGTHWLRAQLAKSPAPPPLPQADNAADFLQAIAGFEFPYLVHHSATVHLVEGLRQAGMVDASVHFEDAPEGDVAVVLRITAKGRDELQRSRTSAA